MADLVDSPYTGFQAYSASGEQHIVPMICTRIASVMEQYLITEVDPANPTRVSAVKIGRFQSDPQGSALRVSVQGGDLEDPSLMDGLVDPDKDDNRLGWRVPVREIGEDPSAMWWRRGTVRLEMFFLFQADQPNEDLARSYAYVVLGRVQKYIERVPVYDLRDSFGEHAIKIFSGHCVMNQSGGPSNSYLWRGRVIWECLTERK